MLSTVLAASLALAAGCDDTTKQFSEGGDAILSVNPEVVTFPQVAVGSFENRTVVVTNEGDGTLYLPYSGYELVPSDAPFLHTFMEVDGEEVDRLEPGEEARITITYAPETDEIASATLTLTSKNGGEVDIQLTTVEPTPLLSVTPNPVDFGDVPTGQSAEIVVELSNIGAANLELNKITYVGQNTADFVVTEQPTTPLTLAPGDATSLTVRYEPTGDAAVTDRGNLIFDTNEPGVANGRRVVDVLGGVSAPMIEVEPIALDFGAIEKGDVEPRTLIVRNIGRNTLEVSEIYLAPGTTAEFSYTDASSLTLEPEEEVELTVSYSPVDSGLDTGSLVLINNDPERPGVVVNLSGKWAGPDLVVSPDSLAYGQVAAGVPVTKTFDILNRGELPLDVTEIQEVNLPADGSITYKVANPVSGALENFAPFTLEANTKRTVHVTFAPVGVLPASNAQLVVNSNDPEGPTEAVTLTFEGLATGECVVQLVPIKQNFGLVAGGYVKTLPIEVRNTGAGLCRVQNITVNSQTFIFGQNPFSLHSPFQVQDIGPGDSAIYEVDYAPYSGADIDTFSAQVGVYVTDVLSGENSLTCPSPGLFDLDCAFSGFGLPPNCWACVYGKTGDPSLATVPGTVDFGLTTLGCDSHTVNLKIYNKGTADTQLNSITLDPACAAPFTLTGVPVLPMNLAAGTFEEIELVYTPGSATQSQCRLFVEATTETLTVPIVGEGTTDENVSDIYDQVSGRKVDVLFVIDNSGSMGDDQTNLANNFASFIQAAQTWGVDFQLGVTTTDAADAGQLQSRNGRPRILTSSTPNLAQAFSDNIQVGDTGSANEQGLRAAEEALTDPTITDDVPGNCPGSSQFSDPCAAPYTCDTIDQSCGGYNARFLRDDAALEIIFVSDEPDQSPAVLDFYVDSFKNIKGYQNDALMHAHAIVGDSSSNPCSNSGFQRYLDVAARTGGQAESLCNNFGTTLANIGNNAFGLRQQFFMSRYPVVATIKVYVNGVEQTTGWTYDPTSNSVVFDDTSTPAENSTIQIDYKAACF